MGNDKNYIINKIKNSNNRILDEEDPYNTSFYQADLIKQTEQVFQKTTIGKDDEATKTQIQLQISLVPGGVNVTYNPELITFANKDEEIQFRREINAFFIRNNFNLNAIYYPVSVYKCGTRSKEDAMTFIFAPNEVMLSESETDALNMIISKVLHKALFN